MENRFDEFQIGDSLFRYSAFVPRFYNLCKSYGFKSGQIMPSRAFCSDENQGFPIILIAKHFGTFPFNHGMVGGIVATDRHGPHAHHGQDLVIIQASHVGYDPDSQTFGSYKRLQTQTLEHTACCGKIGAVMDWYTKEYAYARQNIRYTLADGRAAILIDNLYLEPDRGQGLFLRLNKLIAPGPSGGADNRLSRPIGQLSTATLFPMHTELEEKLPPAHRDRSLSIDRDLTPDLFYFKRDISDTLEGRDQLEKNLARQMPRIVTSPHPFLSAAIANTRIEFERSFRTLLQAPGYRGRNLVFISGINIDISPREGQLFPLTKFIPWAAYVQTGKNRSFIMEQTELTDALKNMSPKNPDKIELSKAIQEMENRPEMQVVLKDVP